ncbi:hypothetical protein AB4Y44_19005 [Paraburkholderia sp. BR10937]|uniref:hypothetical protein n=1 Tax=Paraburkholderia sp. BR10937 TaxID=3236994 RepID=UPI0034D35C7B
MQFLFPIDNDCPESLRKAFFDALKDSSVRRLADEAAQSAAQLSAKFGRLAEIRQAVLLAESTGASPADCLRDRIADLRAQDTGMRQHSADLDCYMKAQRERFRAEIGRCAAVLIDSPLKIEALRAKVHGYGDARAEMSARLREAGLDDDAIQRAGVKPDPSDLAEWTSQIADEEERVRRAQVFVASAPLFDTTLLRGIV